MAEKKKLTYVEPAAYFPKEIRKKWGLGEYWKDPEKQAKAKTTDSKKKSK